MDDANNNCDLHLETVDELQLIVGPLPSRIHPERVGAARLGMQDGELLD